MKKKTQRRKKAHVAAQWLAPSVETLLDIFLTAATDIDRPYAIGGALAMGAHGFRRHTADVDAFVLLEDRGAWFRALKERGLTIKPLFSGVHYEATHHYYPETAIDLMMPAEDPDLSAVEAPDEGVVAGREVAIWPISLLVIAKFRSTRDKDRADVTELWERGLFDPAHVRRIMLYMDEKALAARFWKKYGGAR